MSDINTTNLIINKGTKSQIPTKSPTELYVVTDDNEESLVINSFSSHNKDAAFSADYGRRLYEMVTALQERIATLENQLKEK